MSIKTDKKIDISGLKPEQIAQLKAMVKAFTLQNQLENHNKKDINETKSNRNYLDDIFFESEILQPFNRTVLYGDRI